MTPISPIHPLILNWFDQHGRKNLPWQQHKTPYRVWVSEIMLQQTQVTTVIDYFLRFIERFPTIASLAHASEDDVLHLWTGLGYYARARHLHRAANIIQNHYRGEFPADLTELMKLPGIGRSTAGAILAIAFEKKAPILDGNVKRVLMRLHGITALANEKKVSEQLWLLAEHYTPQKRVAHYTQAIMDLGATLCTRGKPHCEQCPLESLCLAHAQGLETHIPLSKPRKTLPVRQVTLLILQHSDEVLLEKRSATGIWGGLWSLPEIPGHPTSKEILHICAQRFPHTSKKIHFSTPFRHTFSHFHLEILPAIIKMKRKVVAEPTRIWYNLREPAEVGLPAPIKTLLALRN